MSTDKATRDASLAATDRINQWSVDANMRVDVYEALKAFNKTPEAKALKGEQVSELVGPLTARRLRLEGLLHTHGLLLPCAAAGMHALQPLLCGV
jgi:hypothetical protein